MKRCESEDNRLIFDLHGPVSMLMLLTFEPTVLINLYFLYVVMHRVKVIEFLIIFGVSIGVLVIPSFYLTLL